MGIWNNGWNGTDLMDYHIFLLLNSFFSFLLFITNGLFWAYSLLHTLPFSTSPLFCFSRFLLPRVILLLCFRTGLGGLARKRHFLVVETSHRIRAVCMLDSIIRDGDGDGWEQDQDFPRLLFSAVMKVCVCVCVCVDRDKQTNNVEVLDEPCLPTLSLKITIKVVLIESCLLVTFLDEGGSRLSLL